MSFSVLILSKTKSLSTKQFDSSCFISHYKHLFLPSIVGSQKINIHGDSLNGIVLKKLTTFYTCQSFYIHLLSIFNLRDLGNFFI